MAVLYTDSEIEALLQEPKPLPMDWMGRSRAKPKGGHTESHLEVTGAAGSEFRLIFRRNKINALDFSVILAVVVPHSNRVFRLRRYNGRSHEHTNQIERNSFYDFHIHRATQRYQEFGAREDAYAERTNRYGDFDGAVRCLLNDAGFKIRPKVGRNLFGSSSDVH